MDSLRGRERKLSLGKPPFAMHSLLKRALYPVLQPIVRFRGARDRVYLTFDDGPHPKRTPEVLNVLARFGVTATFFMIGVEAQRYDEIARRVVSAGHAVGYHSHTHSHMQGLSAAMQRAELRRIDGLACVLGQPVRLYRPPYGELTPVQVCWCLMHGIRVVMWSLETNDSFTEHADEVAGRACAAMRRGDIVLLHDDTASAIESLPLILSEMCHAGLSFGRL